MVKKLGREIAVQVTRGDIDQRLASWEIWKEGADLGQVRADSTEGEEDGVDLHEEKAATLGDEAGHLHCRRPDFAQS